MPVKRCHLCGRSSRMEEFDFCCEKCREKELDVLIALYWFIHSYGSDYCPVKNIYSDAIPVEGIKPEPIMLKSWINKGYIDINEMGCVGVPKCLSDHLEEKGYNITPAFRAMLNRAKAERMDQYRRGLAQPVQSEDNLSFVNRMVYAERRSRR